MKKLLYIYAITAVVLTSCTDDDMDSSAFLNGKEKTPIAVSLNVDNKTPQSRALSRAVDGSFEINDQLVAYFRHVTATENNGAFSNIQLVSGTGVDPRLVYFKVNSLKNDKKDEANNFGDNSASVLVSTNAAGSEEVGLYWDDFSTNSANDGTASSTYLRDTGHYLQSYYGYCYNGGTSNFTMTDANIPNGIITCTLPYDQSTANGIDVKKADLLWSPTKDPVEYKHTTFNGGTTHGIIEIPYSHAMSMFTVVLVARNGYEYVDDPNAFLNKSEVEVILNGMNRKCIATASTNVISFGTETNAEDKGTIKMYGAPQSTTNLGAGELPSRTFQAIAVPHSALTVGDVLLNINGIDGNNYELKITQDMITAWTTVPTGDPSPLDTDNKTKSGYNYKLVVTLDKQSISAQASLANWITVSASGNGEIILPEDEPEEIYITDDDGNGGSVTFTTTSNPNKLVTNFSNGSSFDLYELKSNKVNDNDTETAITTNDKFGPRKTVSTYNSTNETWTNNPEIFWPNVTDKYYFRAVAKYNSLDASSNHLINYTGETATLSVNQGEDILWGTTAAHKGVNGDETVHMYEEGQAINPRTGKVPIAFRHALSKITVNLETPQAANAADPKPENAVDLEGALISISNLSTSGTLTLFDGKIENGGIVSSAITEYYSQNYHPTGATNVLDNYIVLPQEISENSKVTITLKDNGGTYSMNLKDCQRQIGTDTNGDPVYEHGKVSQWYAGRHYVYTITLEKEKITFRALIKDWDTPVTGSGNATLEWD